MSITTIGRPPASTAGQSVTKAASISVLNRRVRPARVLLGVLLILALALAGVVVAERVDTRVSVLAAARAVNAGQVMTVADIVVVKVATDAKVPTVPVSRHSSVVGQVAAVPLVAGTLLAPAQLGGPAWPAAGQAVIAVPVKPGRLPSGLGAGSRVTVLAIPAGAPGGIGVAATATAPALAQAGATVVSVQEAADQSGTTVVTVVLAAADAVRMASSSGDMTLVRLGG